MERIILGISVFLMLVQNVFAETDAEYNKLIGNTTSELNKLVYQCNKAALNHPSSGNPEFCVKAFNIAQRDYPSLGSQNAVFAGNAGYLYHESTGDKLKAYIYYMKAAKLGNILAQKNLNIMCKESPCACK